MCNICVYSCFISDPRVQYGIFLAPLFTIVIFNVVILALVTRVLFKHNKRKKKENSTSISQMSKMVTSIISIMVMFGTSWLFGAFSINAGAKVFQWLFLIFNTTQGFCLFLFFCVISNDGREEWKKLLTCYKPKKRNTAFNSNHSTHTLKSKGPMSSTTRAKNTYTGSTAKSLSISESDQFKGIYDTCTDIELKEKSFVPQLQDIKEKDTKLLINNEQVDIDIQTEETPLPPSKEMTNVDIQLPPHVMIKLKRQALDTYKAHDKKRKRERRLGVKPKELSRHESQVPPHILHRFRQPSLDYQPLINSQCSFTDDGFSQVSSMGSQP